MLADCGLDIQAIRNPRDLAYEQCLEILKSLEWPITFEELARSACERNEQVLHYVVGQTELHKGNSYKLRSNHKLRAVLEMLLDHSCVKVVRQKPVTLKWVPDTQGNPPTH